MLYPSLPVEFRSGPWRSFFSIAAALGFIALSFWLTQAETGMRRYSVETVHIIGWCGLVLFGATLPLAVWHFFARPALLILTGEGVLQKSLFGKDRLLGWNDINAVSSYKIQRTELLRLHRPDGSAVISVPAGVIGMNADEFRAMLMYYRQQQSAG